MLMFYCPNQVVGSLSTAKLLHIWNCYCHHTVERLNGRLCCCLSIWPSHMLMSYCTYQVDCKHYLTFSFSTAKLLHIIWNCYRRRADQTVVFTPQSDNGATEPTC